MFVGDVGGDRRRSEGHCLPGDGEEDWSAWTESHHGEAHSINMSALLGSLQSKQNSK